MDVLSDALQSLSAGGAVFFRGSLSRPWRLQIPAADAVLDLVGRPAGVDTALMFHAVLRGSLILRHGPTGEPMTLEAGDLLLLSLVEPHTVQEGDGGADLTMEGIVQGHDLRQPLVFDAGQGPGAAKLICGGFFLRNTALHPLLGSLPPVIRVRAGGGLDVVSVLLSLLAAESEAPRMGSRTVVRRLSDLLLVELLRAVIGDRDRSQGWFAALGDPVLCRAIGAIHGDPGADWTVPRVAAAAGVSTSGLTQRFRAVLDQSPGRYLTRWRMHRATLLLQDEALSLVEVAERVGYTSVEAFSRAFKREVGRAPGRWRVEGAQADTG